MGKKKKRKQPYLQKNSKEYVVITKHLEDYVPFDIRSNKPICYKDNSNGGSMVLQEFEEIEFSTRIKDKKTN